MDAAYDTMLTYLLSNISCCYPKSPLDILLKENAFTVPVRVHPRTQIKGSV